MKITSIKSIFTGGLFLLTSLSFNTFAQESENTKPPKNNSVNFWEKVRFGGGVGANFSSTYTNITLAPSAIYQFNQYVAAGVGLQGSYIDVKNNNPLYNYKTYTYGGSLIVLGNPIPQVQLSAELEQLRVNMEAKKIDFTHNFWNTALFLGAGFHTHNVTVGVRYNVLHKDDNNIYYQALMPFVRIYF